MQVPLLDLKAQYRSFKDEVLPEIERLLDSQKFILGSPVEKLEAEVASYSSVEHGIGVASGSDALLLSLMAADIGPGNEVITTPYTFFATASAISRIGAKPVFVDIDPVSYNINPAKMEEKISERTKALLPVHLFGQVADMEPILKIAEKKDLVVIEDAAQAIGAEYQGKRTGALGDAGCFSFFPSKNLGGFGDGGMVVTRRSDLAEKVRSLRVHGMGSKRYMHESVGLNSRLDALQAVVISVKLNYLDAWHRQRRRNAKTYYRLFDQTGLLKGQTVIPPQEIYVEQSGGDEPLIHVYNQYVIRARDRDGLQTYLSEQGIGTAIYYPIPLHLQECFASLGYSPGDFPESERASHETLALPIYPELTEEMQEYVVDRIASYYRDGV